MSADRNLSSFIGPPLMGFLLDPFSQRLIHWVLPSSLSLFSPISFLNTITLAILPKKILTTTAKSLDQSNFPFKPYYTTKTKTIFLKKK
jgi:hypothetical protein